MIPLYQPDVGNEELNQLGEALKSGWLSLGPKVDEFETEFSHQFGYQNVIATGAGTHALDLAIKEADLEGSEILIPAITWVSTAYVAIYNNYDIGWIDVREDTLNMCAESLSEQISTDTAAVIPVHYGGQPGEIDRIVDIAQGYNAKVIEDCAHAVGVEYKGTPVGQVGDIGCFSFQATKPLTTGEGGAVVTQDDDLASSIKSLSKLGIDKSTHDRAGERGFDWYFEATRVGYKYYMNNLEAGIGLAQLSRFEETQRRRAKVAKTYDAAFEEIPWVEPLHNRSDSGHAHYAYTVLVPGNHRESLIAHLGDNGVQADVMYMPVYKHPIFNMENPTLPTTESVWESIVSLPMSSVMTDEDINTVIESVRDYRSNI